MDTRYKPLKIYKASAGSGKTYALAKEYVKILVRNPYAYRQVLAITFTRKATAEMKARILKFLKALRDGKDPGLKAMIVEEIKAEHSYDPSGQVEKNAGEALSRILHDYAHFQVTTIDSFFQHIIRSFAKELNLPIGMAVELDTDKVLGKCVDALMEDYEKGESALGTWLENFAFSKMEEAKGWKIEKNLLKISRELLKEHYLDLRSEAADPTELEHYDQLLKDLKKTVRIYHDALLDKVNVAKEGIENNSIDVSFFPYDCIRSFLNKASENIFDEQKTLHKILDGAIEPLSKTKKKAFPAEAERCELYWEGILKSQVIDILHFYEQNKVVYNSAKHILRNLYSLALMDLLADKLKNYREQENTLLISDANHIIGKIAGEEASPFIFEKTGTFLKYLLIDEFQDTSQMQWKGLLPMVLEIVSQGSGLSLIVGDPKQSIYRWRGGKMELLLKQIDIDLAHFKSLKVEIPLQKNYRSASGIIGFNNVLFEALKNYGNPVPELFQLAYREHEQHPAGDKTKGYMECRWLQKEKADVMLPEVLKILEDAEERREWKDICILVRRNSEGVAIANYLSEFAPGIPFVSGESLLVNSALSVKLLVAAMEYVNCPHEYFYKAKLNYLFSQYFEKAAPEEALKKNPEIYFRENFEGQLPALQKMTMDELLPALLRILGPGLSDAYLLRMQDIVFDFVKDNELSVAAFLEHWNEQKEMYAILPPDGMNAVTISTVHKAKGLEYPVVIIPYLDWSISPKPGTLFWGSSTGEFDSPVKHFPLDYQLSLAETVFAGDFEKETELGYVDIMNVLYVAFTRPKEELYVLCTDAIKDSGKKISGILKNILPGLPLSGAVFDHNRFIYGEKENATKQESVEQPGVLAHPALRDYRSGLALRQREIWNESVWQGDILHEMLAIIEHSGHVHKSARSIGLKYGLSKAMVDEHIKKSEAVMEVFTKNNWFDKKYRLLNEHAIYFDSEELRPDKVLMCDDECIIVDYKTGAQDAKHIQQVQKYKKAYTALLGVPVKAFLLYTKDMQLQEV